MIQTKSLIEIIKETVELVVTRYIPSWAMAEVTSVHPLRVRMDGETESLNASPRNFLSDLLLGDRVEIRRVGTTYTVVAVTGETTTQVDKTPVGTITAYAGANAPYGYLLCNGASFVAADYPELAATIGNMYGGTTANPLLPNFDKKFPVGSSPSYPLGSTGGEEKHTLTIPEIPSHNHNNYGQIKKVGSGADFRELTTQANGSNNAPGSFTGGGGAHNNMPPYVAVNYIIKAW